LVTQITSTYPDCLARNVSHYWLIWTQNITCCPSRYNVLTKALSIFQTCTKY
jgi:hypothetical protein